MTQDVETEKVKRRRRAEVEIRKVNRRSQMMDYKRKSCQLESQFHMQLRLCSPVDCGEGQIQSVIGKSSGVRES